VGSELSTQDEKIRLKAEQMTQRMLKYLEVARPGPGGGRSHRSQDTQELAQEILSYISPACLMQAKIENSVKHVERLQQGVMRHLGIKSPYSRSRLTFFCPLLYQPVNFSKPHNYSKGNPP
jgi:hypothetical protein